MINRTVIVGRLVADPELRYTPNGIASCKFRVAVNRPFKNDGEQQADFISCVAWRKQAENLANFMKKASLIGLEGRIQTGSYEGQDGKRVYTTDVVADSIQFLEPRSNSTGGSQGTSNHESSTNTGGQYQGGSQGQYGGNNNQPSMQGNEDPFANSKGPIEVSEDDLPF